MRELTSDEMESISGGMDYFERAGALLDSFFKTVVGGIRWLLERGVELYGEYKRLFG